MRRTVTTMALAFCVPVAVWGQPRATESPEFEVATVRENRSGETRTRIEVIPSGQFNAMNMTLRELVSIAYPTDGGRFRHANQLVGGPGWFETARFDIVAKTDLRGADTNKPGFTATAAERADVERVRLMLQRLLAERFKLRVRQEMRQLPIYELVVARADRAFGADLKPSSTDCMEEWRQKGKPDARSLACGSIQSTGRGAVRGFAAEIGPLVRDLHDWTGRPVVDRTGLTGRFDFTLSWAPDNSKDSSAPSIFTAVQEQLGLKLESATGPVDVLVVEHAERPVAE
jgi:uncharacterized protein (TIGR03435 family)